MALITSLFFAALTAAGDTVALDAVHLRDPFILPVASQGMYYLFGTGWPLPNGRGFVCYRSRDLVAWEGPQVVFEPPEGFWADRHYWAPEVHAWRGGFYMFASFKAEGVPRGTQILVSDAPDGPYGLHSEGPVTPREWECLDGTLHVAPDGAPWMVFCHEWTQVGDGEICAIPLTPDLKAAAGEAKLLFRASEAPWGRETGANPRGRVTDGPFLHRTKDGALLMLWSSFGEGGYKLAVATSESGTIDGPWRQAEQPLIGDDGGHGMMFRRFDEALMLTFHQPNRAPDERPRLFSVIESEGTLQIAPFEPEQMPE